jgi:NADH-quinone oxidoreductase B subunit
MTINDSRDSLRNFLLRVRNWALASSPWLVHYNSGSCNGCDIEILATLTPRYDLERLGIKLQGSPRHADVLVCTGPVTRQSRDRLRRIYEQMPEPKFVVAVGTCGISGGVFHDCYNILGGIDQVIPVDVYIPGCPPRPEAVIDGVALLLKQLQPQRAAEIDRLVTELSTMPDEILTRLPLNTLDFEEVSDEYAEPVGTR